LFNSFSNKAVSEKARHEIKMVIAMMMIVTGVAAI
jgi:hypothetical protein